jgi:hypothetical protein
MGSYVLQQLGYATPLLIVYLVGIALAGIFVRKYPLPAMLTLAGCVILSVNVVGIAITQGYLIIARVQSGWSGPEYSQMTMIISAIGAIVRALGSALLVAAIFVGRKPRPVNQT